MSLDDYGKKTFTMIDLMPEYPDGPLTNYRKKASFDWRKLKLALDGEEGIKIKDEIYSIFKSEIFTRSKISMTTDQQRHLTSLRSKEFIKQNPYTDIELAANPKLKTFWAEAAYMYDLSTLIVFSVKYGMFVEVVRGLGTEKHDQIIQSVKKHEIVGCFCLTEISHGTNTKGMQTTATYDSKTREFIFNSPNFESAKCWAGVLAKCATHAVVYCMLITPDGQNHGLHPFVIRIRSQDLKTLPGLVIGDLGEKLGLHGIDNGFIIFNSYRVSYDCLLNKYSDIDENGNYITLIPDMNKRLSLSFAILMGGRVTIPNVATCLLQKAVTIATRYSAVRKQFGPNDKDELPIIEYQILQFRLLPNLSAAIIFRIFCKWLLNEFFTYSLDKSMSDVSKMMEFHALTSAIKPYTTWLSTNGIQTCREILGGHGYLRASGIGDLRTECEANCTYEGENSVLVQQTSNWLLKLWSLKDKGKSSVNIPYATASFIYEYKQILEEKANLNQLSQPTSILKSIRWLACYTLKITAEKQDMIKNKNDNFTTRNEIQAYYALPLSLIYAELAILEKSFAFISDIKDKSSKDVLTNVFSLFGSWILEKHLGSLYMGGHYTGNAGQILRENVLSLCSLLKPDAVSLVDVIGPPDHMLDSMMGNSNGEMYANMQAFMYSQPEVMSRPNWWKDVTEWETNNQSKL